MKHFKVLPLAVAVASSIAAFGSFAGESATTNLEERITNIEERMASETNDLVFFGYARYGAHYKGSDSRYVGAGTGLGVDVGRLGNEANGGEFGLSKKFVGETGSKWDLTVMLDDWNNDEWGSSGGINLKRFYAGVSNIIEGQEEMYLWAGRDFHARLQQGLNDYYVSIADGQGAGFKNLNTGSNKLDVGVVGGVDGADGSLGNDTGRYAATFRLHDIKIGAQTAEVFGQYGFASEDDTGADNNENGYMIGGKLGLGGGANLWVRHSTNGVTNNAMQFSSDDIDTLFISLEGGFSPADNWNIDYLGAYSKVSGDDATETSNLSLITRPQYRWDDTHSTWLELGYAEKDSDNDTQDTDAWKVTLSQNVSLGGLPWSRPMLRFYATLGESETNSVVTETTSFGAMFEAWW